MILTVVPPTGAAERRLGSRQPPVGRMFRLKFRFDTCHRSDPPELSAGPRDASRARRPGLLDSKIEKSGGGATNEAALVALSVE